MSQNDQMGSITYDLNMQVRVKFKKKDFHKEKMKMLENIVEAKAKLIETDMKKLMETY
jgi:hypothetical protein